jgi:hypothetical protein
MTAMSRLGENEGRKVIRLEIRRVERRVPGIGPAVFRAPSVTDEMRLAEFYTAEAPDHRAFVNELIAVTLKTPEVNAADVDTWTERARAIARVAVAEAADCTRDYRRLAGSGLNGDERLYRAMGACHERQLEHLRQATAAVRENVLHMVQQTRAPLLDLVSRFARQIVQPVRPIHLGPFEQLSRQIAESVRPGRVNWVSQIARQIVQPVRPIHFYQITALGQWMQRVMRPLGQRLLEFLERYAAWLERNWPEVYANPDHPPPAMFVLASLPMAIGLPLLRRLQAHGDEPLIALLEAAIDGTPLIDAIQTAVLQNAELDPTARRYLVTALDHLRSHQYVDAEPPLYQGLERAFKLVARRRGIVDRQNKFMINARRAKARSVEDLFEHLALERRYLRFLRSWVFGDPGHLARHRDLPETEHRRWVLHAFVALIGWLKYCGANEAPMGALVARLQLEGHKGEQTA